MDVLVSSLSDHLRNLLIARVCGQDSPLIDLPGIGESELAAQAMKFEPAAPSQDITILEELRRNLRQSQTARALLDAILARLALSEQFTSIGELLNRLDGAATSTPSASSPQKKSLTNSAAHAADNCRHRATSATGADSGRIDSTFNSSNRAGGDTFEHHGNS